MESRSQNWQSHNMMTQNTPLAHLVDSKNLRTGSALGNHRSDSPGSLARKLRPKVSLAQGPRSRLWKARTRAPGSSYFIDHPLLWF